MTFRRNTAQYLPCSTLLSQCTICRCRYIQSAAKVTWH